MTTTLVSARVNQAKREALNPVLEDLGVSFSAFVGDAIDSVLQTKQLPTENISGKATNNKSSSAQSGSQRRDVLNFIKATTIDIDWSIPPECCNATAKQAWAQGDYNSFLKESKYQDYISLNSDSKIEE